jgi:hypothetical protein
VHLSSRRVFAIGLAAASLTLGTGCLEGFERLDTHVVYDPSTHAYEVEQTLTNLGASFFACIDADTCTDAIWRALAGEAPGGFENAISDRLSQRLVETGAENVRVTLVRRGDSLDVVARYDTVAGSRAADDTAIRAEWGGKPGRERFYLVVEHQPEMDMPHLPHSVRRAAGAAGWAESWLLRPGDYDVTVGRPIEKPAPIFAAIPGLAERVAGWLDHEWTLGEAPPRSAPPPPPVAVVAAPAPLAAPAPAPVAAPVPTDGWPPPDPLSNARVYVYDPRIGGGYPVDQAKASFAPLLPHVEWCWQQASATNPALQGYIYLDALVRADGGIISTSVYGDVPDRGLLACLERVLDDWSFAPFGAGTQAEVTIPLAVRSEAPPEPPGHRKR